MATPQARRIGTLRIGDLGHHEMHRAVVVSRRVGLDGRKSRFGHRTQRRRHANRRQRRDRRLLQPQPAQDLMRERQDRLGRMAQARAHRHGPQAVRMMRGALHRQPEPDRQRPFALIGLRVDQRQGCRRLAGLRQKPRHLEGDEAAGGIARDMEGAGAPKIADLAEIILRHRGDGGRGCLPPVETARLDRSDRAIARDTSAHGEQLHHIAAEAVHDEQRNARAVLNCHQGRERRRAAIFDRGAKPGDGRRREDRRHRQLGAHRLLDGEHQFERGERIAAQIEEIVVAADAVLDQHAPPDRGKRLFRLAERRGRVRHRHLDFLPLPDLIERSERRAVELGAGQPGDGADAMDALRMQCRRQRVAQRGLETHAVADDIGDKPPLLPHAARMDRDVADAGAAADRRFKFARLDANTADLDLPVLAADEIDQPVGAQAHEIAGAQDAAGRIIRTGRKIARIHLAVDPAAERDIRAAQHQLAGLARRRRLAVLADDSQRIAGQRIAERHAVAFARKIRGHEPLHDRRLGRGIAELDAAVRRQPVAQRIDVAPQHRVAADPQHAQRGRRFAVAELHQRTQQRRHRIDHGDAAAREPVQDRARAGALDVDEMQRGAGQQRREPLA